MKPMILRRWYNGVLNMLGYDAEFWRGPVILGAVLAALTWLVWLFTKVPCTIDNAANGFCNPSALAAYINVDIMSRSTAAWLGATTLTGGINAIMLIRERQRTEEAQQLLAEERRRFDEERRRFDERIETLISESREERRVMMSTIAELTGAIAELRRQSNGPSGGED